MSNIDPLDNDNHLLNNDILISDINLDMGPNGYLPLNEEEKNDSDESDYHIIRREMNPINYFCDEDDDDLYESRYFGTYKQRAFSNNLPFSLPKGLDFVTPLENFNNNNTQIEPHNLNNLFSTQNKDKKKIFNIIKVPKSKQQIFQCLQKKKIGECRVGKKFLCDWDNIPVPKEKHFHFDRKKHRIVFQRKHLKVIYSIVDLAYPPDFTKCFNMIKEHIGNKTVENYDKGKSFHIIKINNEEIIVTLKDKKNLLKQSKNKKRNVNTLIENNEKITNYLKKDENVNSNINGENDKNNKNAENTKKEKKAKGEALFQVNS